MEISSPNIKRFLISPYILGNETFKPKLKKIKKSTKKKIIIFRKILFIFHKLNFAAPKRT